MSRIPGSAANWFGRSGKLLTIVLSGESRSAFRRERIVEGIGGAAWTDGALLRRASSVKLRMSSALGRFAAGAPGCGEGVGTLSTLPGAESFCPFATLASRA